MNALRLTPWRCLAIAFALPVFVHAPALLGFFAADPLYRSSGLGQPMPGLLSGVATIDGNWAGIDQALTTRAMAELFSGRMPWWNPFEGFGEPLAGEMQCSALFPFSLLVALPNGPIVLGALLSSAAGIGMFLLLHRLRLRLLPALAGAVAFEMCGTFAWLSGAWSYAIAWLPFLVSGIELCRCEDRLRARSGIVVTAVSIALLIYSGFIETSYLEGLAGALWAGGRLCSAKRSLRGVLALRLASGGAIGVGLGAPILVAFADTLSMSDLGRHAGAFAGNTLGAPAMLQKFMPYVYGPIFASRQQQVGYVWGGTGGYAGFALPVFALAGIFGRTHRTVRIVCALTLAFGVSAIFGGPLLGLLLLLPAMKLTALYRYVDPSLAFALAVLAALALDDLDRHAPRIRTRIAGALACVCAVVVFAFTLAAPELAGPAVVAADADLLIWHSIAFAAAICCANAIVFAIATRTRASLAVSALTICIESIVFFIVPTLSAPASATIDLRAVRYLQAHLGEQRMFSLGPLAPNYGSYFGLADLDYADAPVPERTAEYVARHFDAAADPFSFIAAGRSEPAQTATFVRNAANYERVGTTYVLTWPSSPPPLPAMRPRFHDSVMNVYELPAPAAYFSAAGCSIRTLTRERATADCAAPSALCRLELNAPGWTASVNGVRARPRDCEEIFQAVALPAGRSTIAFDFVPPYMPFAVAAFALAFAGLAGASYLSIRAPRMRRSTGEGLSVTV